MPTINVPAEEMFHQLGQKMTEKEFDHLCFEFGIELDEVTSPRLIAEKERGEEAAKGLSDEVIYKIEVPANRYDLLCLEGIVRALRIFLGKEPLPAYKIVTPSKKKLITLTQSAETLGIRPYIVSAVLRNVTFTEKSYESFIDLQEKLHQNIGRRRTLIAIGTHDLDTLSPPFTYEALPKEDIEFVALGETKSYTVDKLFKYYKEEKENCHLTQYLPITENHPVHPVIYDSKRRVLSLPPIINGEHSKISLKTKNVFIECTGTDITKLNIVLNTVVAMFSQYCQNKFQVEAVQVHSPEHKAPQVYPQMVDAHFEADPKEINRVVGIDIKPQEMVEVLGRMQLPSKWDKKAKVLKVQAPITRTDILHPCDIVEDVAIAYGYNKITKTVPPVAVVGVPQPINKYSDLLRNVVAQAGYTEVLTWALCATDECFSYLNIEDTGDVAVKLSNPKALEFQIVRTTLLAGLLKTVGANKGLMQLPCRLFELSDVCFLDATTETGSRNNRRCAAIYTGKTSGLEEIHGLLDRLMAQNGIAFGGENKPGASYEVKTYTIAESNNPTFLTRRSFDVFVDGNKVGVFGIFDPKVLESFDIVFPSSALEVDLEALL